VNVLSETVQLANDFVGKEGDALRFVTAGDLHDAVRGIGDSVDLNASSESRSAISTMPTSRVAVAFAKRFPLSLINPSFWCYL
jgi:hypothetical protein